MAEECKNVPTEVCRDVKKNIPTPECKIVDVEKCRTVTRQVDTPVEEEVCRPTTQECKNLPKVVKVKVPKPSTGKKCTKVEQTECNPVEVIVPKESCMPELKPVCSLMPFEECFPVEKEVCKPQTK